MRAMTVILGTAHGINVAGKRSPCGRLREWMYSRKVCSGVRAALARQGVQCTIDIESEREPSLRQRIAVVNSLVERYGDCIYVSIHNNAAGSDGKWHNARGFAVYVAPGASQASRRLASLVHNRAMHMELRGNRCYPRTGYYEQSLAVCRDTHCPAILTENLFQDNHHDVEFLLSREGYHTIVDLHAAAIIQFLKTT